MISDFLVIFYWWIILFGLGAVFLPLTFRLFPKFFDKGYAFSKIIGLLCVSYIVWLLGSLKILQFVPEAVWLVVLVFTLLNYLILQHRNRNLKNFLKKHWKIILFEEALFFICLTAWSLIRGFQPDIIGLEKFMDFGFVNSILRSKYFPPQDMWFAGKTINYYYFGHLVAAILTNLSGLDSTITYNLMIATVFALTFTATLSLGANLFISGQKNWKFPVIAGIPAAVLLTLGGNLHSLWWFLKHGNYQAYWYPDATRFIVEKFGAADNTIHEFPLYSWVVADLHGHMINIPVVLLILALLLRFKPKLSQFLVLALCFATTFMTNIWDIPIYLLVTGLVLWWRGGVKKAAIVCAGLVVGSVLLSLPFHLNFQNIAKGVALADFRSPLWMLLVLWGFPLFITVAAAPWAARKEGGLRARNYTIVLLTVGWLLVLIPEIVYVKDIYINSYQRANTMFKLTYQSFVMFSLAEGYIIVKILSNLKKKPFHFACAVALFALLIFVFIYPFYAVKSYYGLKDYQGLGGLEWLEQQYPNDYEAVVWLKENVRGQPVILEAVGESYTDFARVSANTGLPTVVGWTVHEWLWRGSYDEPGKRAEEVKRMYESATLNGTKNLLKKHRVEYIYLGSLERKKYPHISEEKFLDLGEVIFQNGGVKIYQLH